MMRLTGVLAATRNGPETCLSEQLAEPGRPDLIAECESSLLVDGGLAC